jgi:hypothetical protein
MFFKINTFYYNLKISKNQKYKHFKNIKIVSSLIKEINMNIINNKTLFNSITFNNNKLLHTSLILYLQNINLSNKFHFFYTKAFLKKNKISLFNRENYLNFLNICLNTRKYNVIHFKKGYMFKKISPSDYQLFILRNKHKNTSFNNVLNIKKKYITSYKNTLYNDIYIKNKINKNSKEELFVLKSNFLFFMSYSDKEMNTTYNIRNISSLISFIYYKKGFSSFYNSLFFNNFFSKISKLKAISSFKVLFKIYIIFSTLLSNNKKKKEFLRFYYFLLQYISFFDNYFKHQLISSNITYNSYFSKIINRFRRKYKVKLFVKKKLLSKTLTLYRRMKKKIFKIKTFLYKTRYIFNLYNNNSLGNINVLNILSSYNNEKSVIDSFRVLFTKPLELKSYKFLNSNTYNTNFNVVILKFNNHFFSKIVIKVYSFYKTLNNMLKNSYLNPFYVNNNRHSFYYYFNSLYKRHLIKKLKLKKYKYLFKDHISFYNPVLFNNNKTLKDSSFNNFRAYKNSYIINFFKPTLIKKSTFFDFNSYYDYQVIKDSFYRFDEYNIRYNFKYVYIYFFFKLFKKKIYFHAFSNIFNLYFKIKKVRFLLKKKLTLFLNLDSIGVITYRYTVRNLFITLSDYKGEALLTVSSGDSGHFGYKKTHFPIIRSVIKSFLQRVLDKLFINNITRLKFVIKGHYFNFYNFILPFVRRLTSYDKLTIFFINFLSFLKRYLVFLKKKVVNNKSNFFLDFDEYFTMINRIKHLINYMSILNSNTYIYKYYNYQVLFIQIKGFNNSFIK